MIVGTVYVCWHTCSPSPRVVGPQTKPRKKLVFRYEGVRDSILPLYDYHYYYYALKHS